MAANTEKVKISFKEAEDSNTKYKEIKLDDYCQGACTVNDMYKWKTLKDVLRTNLLIGSWQDTADEHTIVAVMPMYHMLIDILKIVNFATFSINGPDVESRDKLVLELQNQLTSALQSKLTDEHRQSKQTETQQRGEETKEIFKNIFIFLNSRNGLLEISLKLNELFDGKFILEEQLSHKYEPHLRMSVSNENEANGVIKKLNGYDIKASKRQKGDAFIVVVREVNNMEKVQSAIDEGIQKNNSAQKRRCVVM